MLRAGFRGLILPLWAMWLSLAATERPMSVACQMVGTGGVASARHSMAAGSWMQHGTHQAPGRTTAPNCCGCLGDCGTAPMATVPAAGVLAVRSTPTVRRVAEMIVTSAPHVRTDLALPYPNGPPLSALIA